MEPPLQPVERVVVFMLPVLGVVHFSSGGSPKPYPSLIYTSTHASIYIYAIYHPRYAPLQYDSDSDCYGPPAKV